MKTSELLEKAKAKIADNGKWIKGALARNVNGLALVKDQQVRQEGVCFCSIGALVAAGYDYQDMLPIQCLEGAILNRAEHSMLENYNDAETTTHADIMAVFDQAIETAKAVEA